MDDGWRVRRIADPEERGRWDEFVRASPQVNPFSSSAYLEAVAAALGAEVEIWVVCRGDEWLAGVPVLFRRRFGRKNCLIPPMSYHSYVYGPALAASSYPARRSGDHIAITHAVSERLAEEYHRVGYILMPGIDDARPWQWDGWHVTPSYTYQIDLGGEQRLSHALRKQVRKCQDADFCVSWEWELQVFLQMYRETLARQEFNARMAPERFAALAESLYGAGLAWMATAYSPEGQPVTGRIQLAIPGTPFLCDWVAGSRAEYLRSGATPWLMTRIEEEARRRGYRTWDLCGANIPAIARFKSQLGGDLVQYLQLEGPRPLRQCYDRFRATGSRVKQKIAGRAWQSEVERPDHKVTAQPLAPSPGAVVPEPGARG